MYGSGSYGETVAAAGAALGAGHEAGHEADELEHAGRPDGPLELPGRARTRAEPPLGAVPLEGLHQSST